MKDYDSKLLFTVSALPSKTDDVLNALASNASDIISGISDFYRYNYGTDPDSLRDGGNGLFTLYGMQVRQNKHKE